jgi:hypothetical protein
MFISTCLFHIRKSVKCHYVYYKHIHTKTVFQTVRQNERKHSSCLFLRAPFRLIRKSKKKKTS